MPRRAPSPSRRRVAAAVAVLLALAVPPFASAAPRDPSAPAQNPATAANGFAMMHGDTASSDTTPVAGPDPLHARVTQVPLGAVCPSVLVGSDGYPLATCTQVTTRRPTVYLLDPATGLPLASYSVAAGSSVLGGVYTYLDRQGDVVLVDGANDLLRIRHRRTDTGWQLVPVSTVHLGPALQRYCGSPTCDTVVGLVPDFASRVWFATVHGVVGTVDPRTHVVRTSRLPRGEQVGNSISTVTGATAVVTDHALYVLTADRAGTPRVLSRTPYDRGPARKPGQLTWGSGTTPVFFGPHGADYLAVVDNARPHERLLVFALPGRHVSPYRLRPVCTVPVLTRAADSGTEDAPIGYGRTVVVSSTYGFPIPAGATGTSTPSSATFTGGMTRVDVAADGRSCHVVWDNALRSAALPRLALADRRIDTVLASSPAPGLTGVYGDLMSYARIDLGTGRVVAEVPLGTGPTVDALQLVGVTTPDHVLYQGTLTGLVRVAPGS